MPLSVPGLIDCVVCPDRFTVEQDAHVPSCPSAFCNAVSPACGSPMVPSFGYFVAWIVAVPEVVIELAA